MLNLARSAKTLMATAVLALASACVAQGDKNDYEPEPGTAVQPESASKTDLIALRGCEDPDGSCIKINIAFVPDPNGKLCPGFVGAPETHLIDGDVDIDSLQWQAWARNDNGRWEKYSTEYFVVFSPFRGQVIRSDKVSGLARSPRVLDWFGDYFNDNESEFPYLFKYTVISQECPEKPLDPRVRVHR